jgi:hypothetical protein
MAKAAAPKKAAKKSAPAKKSATPAKGTDAGASTTTAPVARKGGPNASFYESLAARGFKEIDQQNQPVENTDYTKGWNGLHAAKTSAVYTKGKLRIETSIDGGGSPTIKMFDGKNPSPVFHSVGGTIPTEDTWKNFVGE